MELTSPGLLTQLHPEPESSKMQTEKVFAHIALENQGHYQTYGNMKELLQSFQLPLALLKDSEQLKVRFHKLSSHYGVPPQQSYAEFFKGRRQELMEELAKNNQDMSKFNESMSHDLLAFVKSYNSSVMSEDQSSRCLRSMRDSMKHLLQEKQDLEMEKETLEEEIVIMSMKNHKAEVREECAQRDKDTLQENLQSAQELIGELRQRNCYLEKKLKKKSLLKRLARYLFHNKNLPKVSRNHSEVQMLHWSQDALGRRGNREKTNEAKNSEEDLENIETDPENFETDLENFEADLENSDEDEENSDEDEEYSDEDEEYSDEDEENSDEDKNSEGHLENIDADLEKIDEGVNKEKDRILRTLPGTQEAVQRSAWKNLIRFIKPKKQKWSSKTAKPRTDVWSRIQSCITRSHSSSLNHSHFQKLRASLSAERP